MDLNEIKEILKIEYGNQKRRQGTPAYSHPFGVAEILKKKGFNHQKIKSFFFYSFAI